MFFVLLRQPPRSYEFPTELFLAIDISTILKRYLRAGGGQKRWQIFPQAYLIKNGPLSASFENVKLATSGFGKYIREPIK